MPLLEGSAGYLMNILHSVHTWLPQTQTWLYFQIINLPDNIINHVVAEDTCNLDQFPAKYLYSLRDNSFPIYLLNKILQRLNMRRMTSHIRRFAMAIRPDAIHSHFGNIGWKDSRIAIQANAKHVVTFYGMDVNYLPKQHPIWRKRYKDLFSKVDRVLCEGPFMAKELVALGCPHERIHVHHLGIDIDRIPFKSRQWSAGDNLRILITGSFREKKGIPYALEAAGMLSQKVPLEITLIGDSTGDARSRNEKKKILSMIKKWNIGDRVHLLGFQPYDYLLTEAANNHIFLSPSVIALDGDTEGGAPVSIIEMAASGMPVVSTTHCDIPEVIENEKGGLLAPERNSTALLERLEWLVQNPHKWEDMTKMARKRIENEFNVRIQAAKLANIYTQLCGGA